MLDKIKGWSQRLACKTALILLRASKSCINSNRFKFKPAANV